MYTLPARHSQVPYRDPSSAWKFWPLCSLPLMSGFTPYWYFWPGSLLIEITSQRAISRTYSLHFPFQIYKEKGKSLRTPGTPASWVRRDQRRSWDLISTEKRNVSSLCQASCHYSQAKHLQGQLCWHSPSYKPSVVLCCPPKYQMPMLVIKAYLIQ